MTSSLQGGPAFLMAWIFSGFADMPDVEKMAHFSFRRVSLSPLSYEDMRRGLPWVCVLKPKYCR